MKKKAIKKLQLSRETLQALTSLDVPKAGGGAEFTPQTGIGCCPTREFSICDPC